MNKGFVHGMLTGERNTMSQAAGADYANGGAERAGDALGLLLGLGIKLVLLPPVGVIQLAAILCRFEFYVGFAYLALVGVEAYGLYAALGTDLGHALLIGRPWYEYIALVGTGMFFPFALVAPLAIHWRDGTAWLLAITAAALAVGAATPLLLSVSLAAPPIALVALAALLSWGIRIGRGRFDWVCGALGGGATAALAIPFLQMIWSAPMPQDAILCASAGAALGMAAAIAQRLPKPRALFDYAPAPEPTGDVFTDFDNENAWLDRVIRQSEEDARRLR